MSFLQNFFDDDSHIVGLCGFKMLKPNYSTSPIPEDFFFNPFKTEAIFETNFKHNVFLETNLKSNF